MHFVELSKFCMLEPMNMVPLFQLDHIRSLLFNKAETYKVKILSLNFHFVRFCCCLLFFSMIGFSKSCQSSTMQVQLLLHGTIDCTNQLPNQSLTESGKLAAIYKKKLRLFSTLFSIILGLLPPNIDIVSTVP